MLTVLLIVLAVMVADHVKAAEATRIKQALRFADISPDKAAVYMEMDRSQLHRQLNGEGHLSHTRLLLLPAEFWRWYHFLGLQDCGLPRVLQDLKPLRMVKMALARKKEGVA